MDEVFFWELGKGLFTSWEMGKSVYYFVGNEEITISRNWDFNVFNGIWDIRKLGNGNIISGN